MTLTALTIPRAIADVPPRRRRWIPVSIRVFVTFLLLVAFGSVVVGLRIYRRHETLKWLAALGESGRYVTQDEPIEPRWFWDWVGADWTRAFGNVECVVFSSESEVNDADMGRLSELTELKAIVLDHTHVTDAGLATISGLINVENLNYCGHQISNEGILHVCKLKSLQCLHLSRTNVTDSSLTPLQRLTQLEELSLEGTEVTDSGLVHVARLTNLSYLILNKTKITDEGLRHLKTLKSLRILNVQDTDVSAGGVDELRQALPRIQMLVW